MNQIKLSLRLQCVANLVRAGTTLVDVGTDHAYLPLYLIQSERITYATAVDLNRGPLAIAQKIIGQYHLEQLINLKQSDGLQGVAASEADDIVIAGMGGELIAKILEHCSWKQDATKHYIFQPMTHSELLRTYLMTHGFTICSEFVIAEENKLYNVFDAYFTQSRVQYPSATAFIGALKDFTDGANRRYLLQQINYLTKKFEGTGDATTATILKELHSIYDNR